MVTLGNRASINCNCSFTTSPQGFNLTVISGGASPSPTLDDVVCAFKSLTSRSCKQKFGIEKMFQRSSAEHIVRDRDDYETRRKYIYENPMRWYYKHLKTEE